MSKSKPQISFLLREFITSLFFSCKFKETMLSFLIALNEVLRHQYFNTVLILLQFILITDLKVKLKSIDFVWLMHRNFAKRQMTWFRCEPMYHWLNASKPLVYVLFYSITYITSVYCQSMVINSFSSQNTILEFIYDAYENKAETLVVPDSVRMNKDVRNSREANALKSYRPRNRYAGV